ncbi:MAG: hypothetical protein B6229_04830 [Spirochaetaceae bacterium 4572_7]|nr:MAG: hypothetical protein B6229_04830 [Spirochaetaceae bacterium 4572_7]
MKFRFFLLVLFIPIISISLFGTNRQDINMVTGMAKYKEAEYFDSIHYLNKVLDENNDLFSEALFWKAKSLYELDLYSESKLTLELLFRKGSIITPYYEDARFLYCKVFFKLERYEDSVLLFNQFNRNPSFSYYHDSSIFWIGESYLQLGDLTNAKKSYVEYLLIQPDSLVVQERLKLTNQMAKLMNSTDNNTLTVLDKASWLSDYIIKEQKNGSLESNVSSFLDKFNNKDEFFSWLVTTTNGYNSELSSGSDISNSKNIEMDSDILSKLEIELLNELGD